MKTPIYGSFPEVKPPHVDTSNTPNKPVLPSSWQCTALLHPYSPPPKINPDATPFFQLCIASISYVENEVLSVQVTGLEYGTWWYKVTATGTLVSTDKGVSWKSTDMGWTLPTTQWLGSKAEYFSTSPLNWMKAQEVQWWKQPVSDSSNATTWTWFDQSTKLPFRLMFGGAPANPTKGDPAQLAFFQNFSFTYFPSFENVKTPNTSVWQPPVIPGFQAGNSGNQQIFTWNNSFQMTALMTPVDSASYPLPTSVLYQWKPDGDYQVYTDRTQCTTMSYEYNPTSGFGTQVAMLYGVSPESVKPTPPLAGSGYLFNETIFLSRGEPFPVVWSCENMGLGQQPPGWASIPAVDGEIHATISNNKALCPNENINIVSVLFPPTKEYPLGRYLWTWYSPFPGSDGSHARPVTFMESASTIAEGGTSLALADYFEYQENPPNQWFPPEYFTLPTACSTAKSAEKNKKV